MSDNPRPDDFDPYRKWLGIEYDPAHPSPVALLGLAPGEETDKERIFQAAARQKERLDPLMLGEHAELAAKLTREVSGAMRLLEARAEAVVGQPVSTLATDGEGGTPVATTAEMPKLPGDTWITGPGTVAGKVVRPPQTEAQGRSTQATVPVQGVPIPQGEAPGPGPAPSRANLDRLEQVAAALGDLAAPERPVVVSPIERGPDRSVIPALAKEEEEGNWVAALAGSLGRADRALREMVGEDYDILYLFGRTLVIALLGIAVVFGVWRGVTFAVRGIAAGVKSSWATATRVAPPPPSPVVKPDETPSLAVAPFDSSEAKKHQERWAEHLGIPVVSTNSIGMKLVLIPPGEFMMGSPDSDADTHNDEKPQHRVRITKPLLLGMHEVTRRQYEQVVGSVPVFAAGLGNDTPANPVSWDDAQDFCRRLSALPEEQSAGRQYRLPSEAEWECACRAGTTTRYSFGDDASALDEYAWSSSNAGNMPQPVGRKKPNAWGLYDVHGNAAEWCADWYDPDYYKKLPVEDPQGPESGDSRVVRGGAWAFGHANRFRAAFRLGSRPSNRDIVNGFRVVCPVPGAKDGQPAAGGSEPLRLQPIPPQTVEVGKTLVVTVVAEGAAASDASLRVTGWSTAGMNSQDGLVIDGATNVFRFTPTEKQGPGTYEITLAVDSPDGRRARAPFTVTVTKPASPLQQSASSTRPETTIDLGGGVTLELVLIPAGSFAMGTPDSDRWATSNEKPSHVVRITRPFYLGKYEVTQEQWQAVMGTNPSYYKGPKNPAENVLWLACQTFLGKLNDRTGTRNGVFVLPTEAQWEYACRAGSTTRWCFGDDESKLRDYAWYGVNAGARTHPVGQKKPNAWGLYDMYGNVSEWCADWFDGGYYRESPAEDPRGPGMGSDFAVRGGWWGDSAARAGSAARTGNTPAFAGSTVGLRVARTIPSGAPAPSAVPYPGMMPGATPPPGMAGSAPSSFPGMPALPPALPGSSNPLVADIEKDRVYQFGDWRMSWPSPGNYVHFWYKEGGTALEIVGASNGWWHWRDGTVEHIVWSNGSVGGQAFYRRPWTQLNREAIAVNGGFREFAVGANWGATRISSNGRELTVTLADGGKISLSPTTSVVQFTTHQGKRTQLPSR